MRKHLVVLMDGAQVGVVTQDDKGSLDFTYEEGWRSEVEATPLSVSMPLVAERHEDPVIRAFLWGLLPDNQAVLERWGRDYGVSARNPFALIGQVGEDCAGAAQFVRPERLDELQASDARVVPLSEADIAARLRELERDPTAWHGRSATGWFSLAGAQPKFALLRNGEEWAEPHGSIPTTHIFKRANAGLPNSETNEHVCLTLARRLGMPAARTRLMAFEDQLAVVSERYDRLKTADGWVRVHQEDLCQAFGLHPEAKYQSQGGPSPGAITDLLRSVLPSPEAEAAISRFIDAIGLNWIIGGTDAHAKNYSLLLSGSSVTLAPLYDVVSVLPYDFDTYRLKFAMKIGHTYAFRDVSARDWRYLADDVGLSPDVVRTRVIELCESIPRHLHDICTDARIVPPADPMPGQLLDLVSERAQVCARSLGR